MLLVRFFSNAVTAERRCLHVNCRCNNRRLCLWCKALILSFLCQNFYNSFLSIISFLLSYTGGINTLEWTDFSVHIILFYACFVTFSLKGLTTYYPFCFQKTLLLVSCKSFYYCSTTGEHAVIIRVFALSQPYLLTVSPPAGLLTSSLLLLVTIYRFLSFFYPLHRRVRD